jgi:hypothetical protein
MQRCSLLLGCRCGRAAKPGGRVADDDEHDDHGRNRVPEGRSLESIGLSSLLPVSILAEMPLACHRSVGAAPGFACWNLWLGTGFSTGGPGAMGHFARQQAWSSCATRSASPCRQSGRCRSITDDNHPGGGCEGQGRKDPRWPPVAGRRVHRDAGAASAADGQAGARELSGSFRPSGWSGHAPPALEDQPPLGLAHDRADRLANAGGACRRSRVSDRRELPQRNRSRCRSHSTGNGFKNRASPAVGRPSKMRSTMSGARSVSRSTRHT